VWSIVSTVTPSSLFQFKSTPANDAVTSGDIGGSENVTVRGTFTDSSSNEFTDDMSVTIRPKELEEVTVTAAADHRGSGQYNGFIIAGETEVYSLIFNGEYSNGDAITEAEMVAEGWTINWTSQNESIMTVDANGDITGVLLGSTVLDVEVITPEITVTASKDIRITRTCPDGGGEIIEYSYCWYLGDAGESCDQVCTGHGGAYDGDGSMDAAGSGAADGAMCQEIAQALYPAVNIVETLLSINSASPGEGYGCALSASNGTALRIVNQATNASDSSATIRRFCACQ